MRSQITEVVCEEGWSYIAEWIGTPLHEVLREAGTLPQVRYIVYNSIESDWWDSVDMADALHPQTLLTWGMNDGDLPVGFGGPLRMRVPRQLGYKSVKYITHLTATDSLKKLWEGSGVGVAGGWLCLVCGHLRLFFVAGVERRFGRRAALIHRCELDLLGEGGTAVEGEG